MNQVKSSIFTEKNFKSKHGNIHYFDSNDSTKEQIHFLHANGLCAGTYLPLLNKLEKKYHVLASDIRGHGDSEYLGNNRVKHWSIFAEDLKDFIENNMHPPIKAVGHSLGAVTTYMAAAKYPHLFSSIILIDPVVFLKRKLLTIFFLQLIGKQGRISIAKSARRRKTHFISKDKVKKRFFGRGMFKTWLDEYVDAYINYAMHEESLNNIKLKCDSELEAQIYESIPTNVWGYAKKIKCPVLLIQGKNSDTFLLKPANELNQKIKNCQLHVIENSGHFVPFEKPDRCVELINNFFSSH